jgi:hypothetical protein
MSEVIRHECWYCHAPTEIVRDPKLGRIRLWNCACDDNGKIHSPLIVIRCACGTEVPLYDSFLNTCACGADYDGGGMRLAPREQWGEETGETLADILAPGDPFEV